MDFKELLILAKEGGLQAKEELLNHYKPLLLKESIIDNEFNEDLYQELCAAMMRCVQLFDMDYNSKSK